MCVKTEWKIKEEFLPDRRVAKPSLIIKSRRALSRVSRKLKPPLWRITVSDKRWQPRSETSFIFFKYFFFSLRKIYNPLSVKVKTLCLHGSLKMTDCLSSKSMVVKGNVSCFDNRFNHPSEDFRLHQCPKWPGHILNYFPSPNPDCQLSTNRMVVY